MEAVKIIEQNETSTRVGGYAVRFGGADLMGDYFTPDTDFMPALVPEPLLTYDHTMRMEEALNNPIGRVIKLSADEQGLWMEAEMQRSHEYHDVIVEMVGKSVIGLSTGSVGHLVRGEFMGKNFKFTRWPVIEVALTTTPAEPRTLGVELLKQYFPNVLTVDGQEALAEAETPQAEAAPQPESRIEFVGAAPEPEGEEAMSENAETTAREAKMDALSAQMEVFLKHMEDSPALRKAGYYTVDGGTADETVKSFGDFLLAVRRNDTKRLSGVYGAAKAMGEDTGAAGGFLVPETYNSQLLQIAAQNSAILQNVSRFPVTTPMGKFPALDQFAAPTAGSGNTATASRATSAKRAEAGAYTETTPQLVEVEYRVADAISGYISVSKELNADSPTSIDALLRNLIGIADGAKQEYYFLRGTGVGEPLGVLNAGALVSVTVDSDNTFAYADAVEMSSRFKSIRGGLWSYHPSIETDIGAFQTGSAGTSFVTDIGAPLRQMLLGYPTYKSEHQPQANNTGCVLLVDWSAYAVFDRGGLEIDFSDQAEFLNGKVTWRFSRRLDGKPWWMSAQTLADPQGSFTISPYVKLDD